MRSGRPLPVDIEEGGATSRGQSHLGYQSRRLRNAPHRALHGVRGRTASIRDDLLRGLQQVRVRIRSSRRSLVMLAFLTLGTLLLLVVFLSPSRTHVNASESLLDPVTPSHLRLLKGLVASGGRVHAPKVSLAVEALPEKAFWLFMVEEFGDVSTDTEDLSEGFEPVTVAEGDKDTQFYLYNPSRVRPTLVDEAYSLTTLGQVLWAGVDWRMLWKALDLSAAVDSVAWRGRDALVGIVRRVVGEDGVSASARKRAEAARAAHQQLTDADGIDNVILRAATRAHEVVLRIQSGRDVVSRVSQEGFDRNVPHRDAALNALYSLSSLFRLFQLRELLSLSNPAVDANKADQVANILRVTRTAILLHGEHLLRRVGYSELSIMTRLGEPLVVNGIRSNALLPTIGQRPFQSSPTERLRTTFTVLVGDASEVVDEVCLLASTLRRARWEAARKAPPGSPLPRYSTLRVYSLVGDEDLGRWREAVAPPTRDDVRRSVTDLSPRIAALFQMQGQAADIARIQAQEEAEARVSVLHELIGEGAVSLPHWDSMSSYVPPHRPLGDVFGGFGSHFEHCVANSTAVPSGSSPRKKRLNIRRQRFNIRDHLLQCGWDEVVPLNYHDTSHTLDELTAMLKGAVVREAVQTAGDAPADVRLSVYLTEDATANFWLSVVQVFVGLLHNDPNIRDHDIFRDDHAAIHASSVDPHQFLFIHPSTHVQLSDRWRSSGADAGLSALDQLWSDQGIGGGVLPSFEDGQLWIACIADTMFDTAVFEERRGYPVVAMLTRVRGLDLPALAPSNDRAKLACKGGHGRIIRSEVGDQSTDPDVVRTQRDLRQLIQPTKGDGYNAAFAKLLKEVTDRRDALEALERMGSGGILASAASENVEPTNQPTVGWKGRNRENRKSIEDIHKNVVWVKGKGAVAPPNRFKDRRELEENQQRERALQGLERGGAGVLRVVGLTSDLLSNAPNAAPRVVPPNRLGHVGANRFLMAGATREMLIKLLESPYNTLLHSHPSIAAKALQASFMGAVVEGNATPRIDVVVVPSGVPSGVEQELLQPLSTTLLAFLSSFVINEVPRVNIAPSQSIVEKLRQAVLTRIVYHSYGLAFPSRDEFESVKYSEDTAGSLSKGCVPPFAESRLLPTTLPWWRSVQVEAEMSLLGGMWRMVNSVPEREVLRGLAARSPWYAVKTTPTSGFPVLAAAVGSTTSLSTILSSESPLPTALSPTNVRTVSRLSLPAAFSSFVIPEGGGDTLLVNPVVGAGLLGVVAPLHIDPTTDLPTYQNKRGQRVGAEMTSHIHRARILLPSLLDTVGRLRAVSAADGQWRRYVTSSKADSHNAFLAALGAIWREGGDGGNFIKAIAAAATVARASKEAAANQRFVWLPPSLLQSELRLVVTGYFGDVVRRRFLSVLSAVSTPTTEEITSAMLKTLSACESDLLNEGLTELVFRRIHSLRSKGGVGAALDRSELKQNTVLGAWLEAPNLIQAASKPNNPITSGVSSVVVSSISESSRMHNVTTPQLRLKVGERGWTCAAVCSGKREPMLAQFQSRLELATEEVTGWVDAALDLLQDLQISPRGLRLSVLLAGPARTGNVLDQLKQEEQAARADAPSDSQVSQRQRRVQEAVARGGRDAIRSLRGRIAEEDGNEGAAAFNAEYMRQLGEDNLALLEDVYGVAPGVVSGREGGDTSESIKSDDLGASALGWLRRRIELQDAAGEGAMKYQLPGGSEQGEDNVLACIPSAFHWSMVSDCRLLLQMFPTAARCVVDTTGTRLAPSFSAEEATVYARDPLRGAFISKAASDDASSVVRPKSYSIDTGMCSNVVSGVFEGRSVLRRLVFGNGPSERVPLYGMSNSGMRLVRRFLTGNEVVQVQAVLSAINRLNRTVSDDVERDALLDRLRSRRNAVITSASMKLVARRLLQESQVSRLCPCIDAAKAPKAVIVPLNSTEAERLVRSVAEVEGGDASYDEEPDEAIPADANPDGAEPKGSNSEEIDGLPILAPEDLIQESTGMEDPCPCPLEAPYAASPAAETACLSYLSNYSNVVAVEPMLSDLRFGRTAKLRVVYRHPCLNYHLSSIALTRKLKGTQTPFVYSLGVGAVLKVPQSLFPIEPYAEYVSFEIDRLLRLNLVPITTWLFVPVDVIEAATRNFRNTPEAMKSDEQEAEGANVTSYRLDGSSGNNEYSRWFSQEVLRYAAEKNLIVIHPHTQEKLIGCSVQLWVGSAGVFGRTVPKPNTVHQLVHSAFHGPSMPRQTPLDFDNTFSAFLSRPSYIRALSGLPTSHSSDYHSASSTFDPRRAFFAMLEGRAVAGNKRLRGDLPDGSPKANARELAELDAARKELESKRLRERRGPTTTAPPPTRWSLDQSLLTLLQRHPGLKKGVLHSNRRRANFHSILQYLSDQALFDSVIGNDDRDSIKNAHVQSLLLGAIMPRGRNQTAHVKRCLLDSIRGSASKGGMSSFHSACNESDVVGDPHFSESVTTLGLVTDPHDGGDATALLLERRHRFVLIDQGKSFYLRFGGPRKAIPLAAVAAQRQAVKGDLVVADAVHPLCIFRRSTAMRLHGLGGERLLLKLDRIVPRPLLGVIGTKRLRWAQDRVNLLLTHIDRCVHAFGEPAVFLWD